MCYRLPVSVQYEERVRAFSSYHPQQTWLAKPIHSSGPQGRLLLLPEAKWTIFWCAPRSLQAPRQEVYPEADMESKLATATPYEGTNALTQLLQDSQQRTHTLLMPRLPRLWLICSTP